MLRQTLGRAALAAAAFAAVVIVLAAILGAAAAHATTYRLENVVSPRVDYAARLSTDPEVLFGLYPITLNISSAAVQRGSFDYRSTFSFGRHVSGDVADFIDFSLIDGPPGDAIYSAFIDLTFDSSGEVSGGSLTYTADTVGVSLACTGTQCSGTAILGASTNYYAPISGVLLDPEDPASVPEPTSLALFLAGIIGLTLGSAARWPSSPKGCSPHGELWR